MSDEMCWISSYLSLSLDFRSRCFSFVAFLRSFSNALEKYSSDLSIVFILPNLTQKGDLTQSPLTLRVLLALAQTSLVQEDVPCFILLSRFSFLAGNPKTLVRRRQKRSSLIRILTRRLSSKFEKLLQVRVTLSHWVRHFRDRVALGRRRAERRVVVTRALHNCLNS